MNGLTKCVMGLCVGVLVGDVVGSSANAAVDINAGMAAEWLFEEGQGDVVRDTSDNNNNAVLNGGPAWVADGIGTAMRFDGKDDYLDAGAGAKLDITEKVSLEAWLNPEKPSMGEPVVAGKDMSSYAMTWSGTVVIFYINAGHIKCVTEIPMNRWSHVVGTYDGNRMLLYVNGSLVSGYIMDKPGTPIESRGDSAVIGRRAAGYYCGMVDNVRIFNRPLSAKEVKAHYDEEVKLVKKTPPTPRAELKGFALKVHDAGADRKTLVVKEKETVHAGLTVPANICLQFEMGGVLHVNQGASLRLECPVQAPMTRVFAGPGSVVFAKGVVEKAWPQWWGAKGDGAADDTAAIQAAMDAFPTGGVVSFPAGTYHTTATLKYNSGLTLVGPAKVRCTKAVSAILESYNPKARSGSIRIKALSFNGGALNGDRCDIGINFTNTCASSFEDVGVGGCKIGILMDGPVFCGYNSMMRMSIGGCNVGIEFRNSAIKTTLIGSNIGAVDTGILVTTTNELDIFGVSIEGFNVGIDVKRGDTVHMQHVYFANDDRGATGIRIAKGVGGCTIVQPRYSHVTTPIDNQSSTTLILADDFPSERLRANALFTRGISAGKKSARNLRGSVVLSGGQERTEVKFETPEPDADYFAVATVVATTGKVASEATRVRIDKKAASGFEILSEKGPGDGHSVRVDWILVR